MNIPTHWKENNKKLEQTFTFHNFKEALNFVNEVGQLAEAHNHHPDIELFSYKHVRISMNTHDAGDIITKKDIKLAEQINKL